MSVEKEISLKLAYEKQVEDDLTKSTSVSPFAKCPIAAIFSDHWGEDNFFRAASDVLQAETVPFYDEGVLTSVALKYSDRSPEVWVAPQVDHYLSIYERFSQDQLGYKIETNFKEANFDVDHAYSRSAMLKSQRGLIRLRLVPSKSNRSWGAYFERKLKDHQCELYKQGLRNETVAIRAKHHGILAPKKGGMGSRNMKEIERVVDDLISRHALKKYDRSCDVESLAAFCDIADGGSKGMVTTISIPSSGQFKLSVAPIKRL